MPTTVNDLKEHASSFGAMRTKPQERSRFVRDVFESVASRYDLMNDLMSLGVHRIWKREFVTMLLRDITDGRVVDVAGGTGDIAYALASRNLSVDVIDINPAMLDVGRSRRTQNEHAPNWICGNAEALPMRDSSVDAYTIAFGIRNVTYIEQAMSEACRVLRPGGRFLCLEFGKITIPLLNSMYDQYASRVLPRLGELVAGDRDSYQYLVESIARFPHQNRFAEIVEGSGLSFVRTRNMSGGIAVITSAWRL